MAKAKAVKQEDKKGLARYFRGVKSEFKKVVWPSKDTVIRYTGIVIITVIVVALLLSLYDKLVMLLFRPIY
ncbi:MAG: preprotein translocase subunit SecE [Tissierellia bacterium]|nr:preprotein translocase subunit SecE [Tissierellia bacterium]